MKAFLIGFAQHCNRFQRSLETCLGFAFPWIYAIKDLIGAARRTVLTEILELGFTILAGIVGTTMIVAIVYLLLPLPYPFKTESDYSHPSFPWWGLYYCHKYVRPKRRAEKGSGLEQIFRNMDFHFDTSHLENPRTFTLTTTGDLMYREDLTGEGAAYLFDEVGGDLFAGDLSIGNLECAVNPHCQYHEMLRFSVSPEYATPLLGDKKHGRFDAVTLGNNHINDSLHQGIEETCRFLDAEGIAHIGANPTAQAQDRILMLEREGARIALLSYTFSTNGVPLETGKEFGTNLVRFNALCDKDYDPSLILRHIRLAKEQGADYIVAGHHWGMDLEIYPPSRLVERARELLEAGIDLIIGHHPHVLGPVERYRTRDGRDTLVFYSLGNLTAHGLLFPIQRLAAVASVTLTVGTDAAGRRLVTPAQIKLIPTLFGIKKINGVMRGFIRKVKPWAARIRNKESGLPLSTRERMEIRNADDAFRKYFEYPHNGIAYR